MTKGQKFIEFIKEKQEKEGLLLKELAEKLDLNFFYFSKIEKGTVKLSRGILEKLYKVYNSKEDTVKIFSMTLEEKEEIRLKEFLENIDNNIDINKFYVYIKYGVIDKNDIYKE